MSLYVFNITPDKAIVSADSRMSGTAPSGLRFKINDKAQKLYIVNDIVITFGGVYIVCEYIIKQFQNLEDKTISNLYGIVRCTVENIEKIAQIKKWPISIEELISNKYLIEVCAVQYNPFKRCNVFYNVSTMTDYKLMIFPVDGINSVKAKMFGGIDTEIVRDYFEQHPDEVESNYESALLNAYKEAASENVGGVLNIATLERGNVSLLEVPIKDSKPIRKCVMGNVVLHNIVGNNLHIQSENSTSGIKQFSFDTKGAFLNNAEMVMQKDGGGQILFDPRYGISGGTSNLYTVSGTTVVPSFINQSTGEIILDDDGMPINSNFYLDINTGNPYFRGTVFANAGKFSGVVQASDFLDDEGNSMLDTSNKFKSDYLNLKGLAIKDDSDTTNFSVDSSGHIYAKDLQLDGSINLTGDITWSASNSPVVVQYSVDGLLNWHSTYSSSDYFMRCSYDGGISWTSAMKVRGTDGTDGVSPTLPSYITSTGITSTSIWSPTIFATDFYVYPSDEEDYAGSYNIIGRQLGSDFNMFKIRYQGYDSANSPSVALYSPGGADMYLANGVSSAGYTTGVLKIGMLPPGMVTSSVTNYHRTDLYGKLVLQEGYTYGDTLPAGGVEGQIFFLKA